MCIFNGCDEQRKPGSDAWLVGEICDTHFTAITGKIIERNPTVGQDWAEDFAKICILMMSRNTLLAHIRELSQKLQEIENGLDFTSLPDEDYKPNVHNTLQYYEKKCWFSPLHIVPLGILTATDFFGFIRDGYVLDDFGAGYTHGGYTHRLQWFAIMRASTNRFTVAKAWNHSAFELYTELARLGLTGAMSPGGINIDGMAETIGASSESLWGAMLDQGGRGPYFNKPDELHDQIMNGTLHNSPIGIAIRQHQRDWGQRAWSNFKLTNINRKLDNLVAAEENKHWWQSKKNARQLLPRARREFQNELGGVRDGFLGTGGVGFNQNSVRSGKALELEMSGWVLGRAGALIKSGTTFNMDANRVQIHRTASRVVFVH